MNVELLVDARAELGEGPVWHPRQGRLYWVDIEGKAIHVYDPQGQPDTVYGIDCRVGAVVPRRRGGLVLATDFGFESFNPQSGTKTAIFDPEADRPDSSLKWWISAGPNPWMLTAGNRFLRSARRSSYQSSVKSGCMPPCKRIWSPPRAIVSSTLW